MAENASAEETLAKLAKKGKGDEPAAPAIPFTEATYRGEYYKSGGKGREATPFEVTVKIPLHWLMRMHLTPNGVFHAKYAPRIMKDQFPGYSGIRTVSLAHCTDKPNNMIPEKQVEWTGKHGELCELAKVYAPQLRTELHPTPDDLRFAIKEYLKDKEAFLMHQTKRLDSGLPQDIEMDKELAELGY